MNPLHVSTGEEDGTVTVMYGFEAFFWNFVRMAIRDGQLDWCMHHRLIRLYEATPDLREPARILQIGRGEGGGELLLSVLYPSATVFSIDNEEVKPLGHILHLTEALDLHPVSFVADSASPEALAFADEHKPFDLLVIDGCHYHGYPMVDFENYAPRTQGYVVFDDYSQHFSDVLQTVERVALRWPCVLKDPELGLAVFTVDGASIPSSPVPYTPPPRPSPPDENSAADASVTPTTG